MPSEERAALMKKAYTAREAQQSNRHAMNAYLGQFSSAESLVSGPDDLLMQEDMYVHLIKIFRLVERWKDWSDSTKKLEILEDPILKRD